MSGLIWRTNWFIPSAGKEGVMKETCRVSQKDVMVFTDFLS